jgi:1-acyl-sn-glycerol-3-phosphate acyltransferase
MLYSFLRILVGFTLRIFFRKIYIIGTVHVRADKPQLIASNHPSGFLEPLIMACFFPKPLHFLVRGDVFDNPFLRPLLRGTNQIPVFRFRDGFSRLRENSQSIDESLDVLKNNQNLLIFAEGNTQSIKKLRPLQKGISRIAFQSMENNSASELEILPVGINFSQFLSFDEVVMLRIGPPVKVKEYMSEYNLDKNKGHQKILDDVYHEMKKNVIHLDHQERIHVFEKLCLLRNMEYIEGYNPFFSTTPDKLDRDICIAQKTDALGSDKLSMVKEELHNFEQHIKSMGMSFKDLNKRPFNVLKLLILILGFIPAFFGLIFHVIPLTGGYLFMKKNVDQLEFKSSILMVSTLILLMIFYIILFVVVILFDIPLFLMPAGFLCGLWLRFYYTEMKSFSLVSSNTYENIRKKAASILEKI